MSYGYSQQQMVGLGISFLIIPTVAVGLRIWAKTLGPRRLAWDDYLISIALAFSVGCCVVQLIASIDGQLGQHQTDAPDGAPLLNDARFLIYEQSKFALQMLSDLGFGFTKASVLVFYMNIFSPRRFRIAAQIMLVVVAAWTVAFFMSHLFTCYPVTPLVEAFYDNKCVDTISLWYSGCVTDILLDVMILAMPVRMVLKLQLPLQQRLAVLGMFSLGATVCAVSITRMVMFVEVVHTFPHHFNDETYYTSPVFFWTVIELSLGVVSACLPTLRPIYLHYRGPERSSTKAGSKPYKTISSKFYSGHMHQKVPSSLNEEDREALTQPGVRTHIEGVQLERLDRPLENADRPSDRAILVEQGISSHSTQV